MLSLASTSPLSHHDLISRAAAAFRDGPLSLYEIADFYTSNADAPIQIAARRRDTGRVYLLDLNRDATIDTSSLPA